MKYSMLTMVATVGIGGAIATAGSLDLDAVSADATWMVHVDVERFADSTIGRFIQEHGDDIDLDMDDLEEMQDLLGLDPWRDVMGVTVYGADEDDEDCVMVLVANDRIHGALRNLAELDGVDHEEVKIDRYDAHRFEWDDETHYVYVRDTRGSDRNIVVLADDRDTLVEACRVLDGRTRSLSRGDSPLAATRPRSGSVVFIAAADVQMFEDIEPASEIARLADAVVIDVGETDEELFAFATVSADNRDDARDIVQVLQGMLALGRLIANEDGDLAPLRDVLRGIEVDSEGQQIKLGIELPTAKLIEGLEALDQLEDDDEADDDLEDDNDADDEDDERHRRRQNRRRGR